MHEEAEARRRRAPKAERPKKHVCYARVRTKAWTRIELSLTKGTNTLTVFPSLLPPTHVCTLGTH